MLRMLVLIFLVSQCPTTQWFTMSMGTTAPTSRKNTAASSENFATGENCHVSATSASCLTICSVNAPVRERLLACKFCQMQWKWWARVLVDIPPGFGNGARFDGDPLGEDALRNLRKKLNGSGYFREIFGGSITLFQTAHLVCECRQYTFARFRNARLRDFFATCQKPFSKRATREQVEERRKDCESVSDFAL